MTDLEATRLCAEAMELKVDEVYWAGLHMRGLELSDEYDFARDAPKAYWPLTDDDQAMALVKRSRLRIKSLKDVIWCVETDPREDLAQDYVHDDLNRCIVYCVAAMQVTNK